MELEEPNKRSGSPHEFFEGLYRFFGTGGVVYVGVHPKEFHPRGVERRFERSHEFLVRQRIMPGPEGLTFIAHGLKALGAVEM